MLLALQFNCTFLKLIKAFLDGAHIYSNCTIPKLQLWKLK
ncbi:3991_t:CDS:2 [Dentiscutata heterogama]|uniref:3991_t:CDS:1 n=1 Tax=Dentiscutata heterogama TaxID=1316150 RepID=A0ACA9KLI7_9GLOM|nr:3991_t:CDS:2 [Dentiscutata heterogama]